MIIRQVEEIPLRTFLQIGLKQMLEINFQIIILKYENKTERDKENERGRDKDRRALQRMQSRKTQSALLKPR